MNPTSTPAVVTAPQEACIKVLVASNGQVEQVVSQISCTPPTTVSHSYDWGLGILAVVILFVALTNRK